MAPPLIALGALHIAITIGIRSTPSTFVSHGEAGRFGSVDEPAFGCRGW